MNRRIFTPLIIFLSLAVAGVAHAATLSLSPSTGTFSVGSTFDVSILLDTNGKSVNALAASLAFPPDMLQVVSPSLGQSVIGVWTAAPKFDNITGRIDLQGGIPGGITASNALISTITFRVKSVGSAILKFLDGSKVLLNDGLGTDALTQSASGIYDLKLPPPAGPEVASDTNPDETEWYQDRTVTFRFASDAGVQGYSYSLSDDPTTIPGDINLGTQNTVTYSDLADGIHFFHVKSLRDGVWGGTSHYSVKIDSTPPADFLIGVVPSSRTSDTQPVIQFATTDALSGIDHYEMKIVPLSSSNPDILFSEAVSPYVSPALEKGSYDIIVRAYDVAHNYREVTQRMVITTGLLSFIDPAGLRFGDTVLPWLWVGIVLLAGLAVMAYLARRARRFHADMHAVHKGKKLPETVAEELEELKRYRSKYGTKALVIMFGILSLLSVRHSASAQSAPSVLATPVITTISKDISNNEIFYAGGKTDTGNETVVIYIQSLDTGAMLTDTTVSDASGNWFYREPGFLTAGPYRLWVQGRIKDDFSPPGPQTDIAISRTAIQFGSNRLSYDVIYLLVIILMGAAMLALLAMICYHYYHGRKKRRLAERHTQSAEESIRRGFALVRRDIEDELLSVRNAIIAEPGKSEHGEKEQRLLGDLSDVEKRIGKEVWDIEKTSDPEGAPKEEVF